MPGRMHADFQTHLQREGASVLFLAALDLPGGVFLLSDNDTGVPTGGGGGIWAGGTAPAGTYLGKVINWGPIDDGLPARDGGIEMSTTFITFEDSGRTFADLVNKYGTERMRGSICVIYMATAAQGIGPAKWLPCFTGIVAAPTSPAPRVWSFTVMRNDRPLRAPIPRRKITPLDAPNALDKTIYDRRPTLIYGVHSSVGLGDDGAVVLPCWDRASRLYGDTIGWITYDRVYKNGVLQSTGFSTTRPTVNGVRYSLLSVPGAVDADVISADVTGYTAGADGTGGVVTGLSALRHLADNFIWGNSNGLLWATPGTTAPFDATLFGAIETVLSDMGWQKVSELIGGSKKMEGRDALNAFCRSVNLAPFWTNLGKIAFALREGDHRTQVLWYGRPRLFQYDIHQVGGSFSLPEETSGLTNQLTASYLFKESKGGYTQSIEVRDQLVTDPVDEAPSEVLLPWSHRSLEP